MIPSAVIVLMADVGIAKKWAIQGMRVGNVIVP